MKPMSARFVVGAAGLAMLGIGLLGSGAMGILAPYFADAPVWFLVLFVSGFLQVGAVAVLLAGRADRLVLLASLPAVGLGAFALHQAGDWNLLLGEIALLALALTGWRPSPVASAT